MWSYGSPLPNREREKMKNNNEEPVDEEAYASALEDSRLAVEGLKEVHKMTNPKSPWGNSIVDLTPPEQQTENHAGGRAFMQGVCDMLNQSDNKDELLKFLCERFNANKFDNMAIDFGIRDDNTFSLLGFLNDCFYHLCDGEIIIAVLDDETEKLIRFEIDKKDVRWSTKEDEDNNE